MAWGFRVCGDVWKFEKYEERAGCEGLHDGDLTFNKLPEEEGF